MKYINILFINKENKIESLLNNKNNVTNKYTYKNIYGYNLKINDLVIVRVYDNDFSIGFVTDIFDDKDFSNYSQFNDKEKIKEIIGIINVKKAKEYNKTIEETYKQMSKLALLEQIAQKDSSFKEMLNNYKKLLNKISK